MSLRRRNPHDSHSNTTNNTTAAAAAAAAARDTPPPVPPKPSTAASPALQPLHRIPDLAPAPVPHSNSLPLPPPPAPALRPVATALWILAFAVWFALVVLLLPVILEARVLLRLNAALGRSVAYYT